MGMFDSIYIDIRCPYCGNTSLIECQTKDTECILKAWYKGDNIGTNQFNYLDCHADCQDEKCVEWRDKKVGYHSGFGRSFYVRIILVNGVVTGDYEIFRSQ